MNIYLRQSYAIVIIRICCGLKNISKCSVEVFFSLLILLTRKYYGSTFQKQCYTAVNVVLTQPSVDEYSELGATHNFHSASHMTDNSQRSMRKINKVHHILTSNILSTNCSGSVNWEQDLLDKQKLKMLQKKNSLYDIYTDENGEMVSSTFIIIL